MNQSRHVVRSFLAGLALATILAPAASAATLTWGTSGTGGRGTWDTTTAGWWNGSALTTWSNAAPDSAVFAGTPSVVSMGSAITAGSVTFNVNGFALGGNNNLTASTLAGSGNATWLSSGTLTLSGSSTYTGQFTIASGLVTLNSGASLKNAAGIVVTGGAGTVGGTGYPFKGITRNGTLYLRDDTGAPGANQLMTTGTVTMRNGTILWYSGGGADSTTITNVLLDTGFNSIGVAPAGGTPDALTITNLTRSAGATAEFRSSYAPMGTGGEVQVKVTNLNGAPVANTNGILGGWAFVSQDSGENALVARSFAAWNPLAVVGSSTGSIVAATPDNANGTSGATTNSSDIAAGTSTQNWLINDSSTRNTISSGTVVINSLIEQADLKINNGSTLVLQSGGLIFRNNNFWMQTTAGATGFLTSGINDLYAQVDGGTGDQFIKVIITDGTAGAVTLRKSGTGTLKVNQVNTYSGGTVINQGTLLVAGASFTPNGFLGTGTATINGGGVLQPNAAHVFGWTGGAFTPIAINDGGTFAIGGNDNYIGSLSLTDNAAITGNSGNYVGLATGTISYTGNYATSQATIAPSLNLRSAASGTVNATFTVNGSNPAGDLVANGAIFGGGGVTKAGAGTLVFSASNTYSGTTTINAGTLVASSSNSLPGFGTSGRVVFGGGTLQIPVNGTAWTMDQADTIFSNATKTSGALALDIASGTQTQTGSGYSGGIGLTKLGAGTLVLAANNTYSGTTTIASGTLQVGTGGSLGSGGVVNAATLAFNSTGSGTVSGGIAGAGLITQIGTGTTTLTGNSTNTGNVTINAGTLKVSGAGASLYNGGYNNTAVVTVNAGGTLELDSFAYGAAGSLGQLADYSARRILAGGTINIVGTTQSSGNDFQVANGSSGGFFMAQGGQTLTLAGNGNANILIGGPLTIGGAGNITVAEVIENNTGAGSIIKTGTGTLSISTQATYTGNTTVNAGVLALTGGGGAAGTIRGTVTVNAGAELRLSTGDATGYNGGASSLGTINLVGGTMNVAVTNNQTLGSATLNLTGGAITGTSGGNLDFFGGGSSLNSLASATTSTISGVPLSPLRQGSTTFTVAPGTTPSGVDLDISSVIRTSPSGDGATAVLTKAGAGTLRLSGTNTYAKPTTIRSGTLLAANASALGTSGTVTLGDASTGSNNAALLLDTSVTGGQVNLARPIVVANQGSGTAILGSSTGSQFTAFTGPVTLAKDVMLYGGNSFRTSFTGTISGNGNVTVAGPGVVAYRVASNTYTGSTTINAGSTLQLGDGNAGGSLFDFLPDNYAVTVSGTLNLQKTGTSETIDALLGGGVVAAQSGADALVVGNAGGSGTFTGVLRNDGGTLAFAKSGAGTQVLTGSNTYTGATTITGGTLEVGGSGVLGGGSYAGAIANDATLSIASSANQTLSGGIAGSGRLLKSGTGTLTLSGSNSYSGGSLLAAGVVSLANTDALGTTGTLSFSGGTLQYTSSNFNDYSDRFSTAAAQAFSIDTNGQAVTYATALTSAGATFEKLGSGTLALAGNSTYSGNTTIAGGVLQLGSGGASGSVAGGIVNNATLAVNRSDAFTLSNTISGTGGLVQAGTGTTTLSAVNSYSGATTITGGMLSVSQDANLGTAPGSATPASLVINGGGLAITTGFTLSPNRGIALGPASGAGTGTFDIASGQTVNYAGSIANNGGGTGGLVKAGGGILAITGNHTYTGTTSVNAGTLQVTSGSLASTAVVVAGGATLSGAGTLAATTVGDPGILTPGVVTPGVGGIGTLTLSSLTFTGSATVNVGVQNNATSSLLQVNGNVTTAGANTVTFAFGGNLASINSGTYTLLSYTGTQLADVSAFLVSGGTGGRQSVTLVNATQAVNLEIGNAFPIWSGTDGSGWSTADNWVLSGGGGPTSFLTNDTVVFNDSGDTGNVTLSQDVNPATTTFSGTTLAYSISSAGGFGITTGNLVKTGPATLTISTSNSYSGGTTLSAGTIRVGNDAALGTGALTVSGSLAGMTLSSDGATPRTLGNGLQLDGDVTLGNATDNGALALTGTVTFGGNTRTITTPSNVTLSGPVTNGGFTKAGAGVLTVTGSNDYAGGTTLSAGTLRVGDNAALGAGGIALNGGVLSSDSATARTLANAMTIGGDVTLGDTVNTGALTLGGAGVGLGGGTRQVTTASDVTFAGVVSNGGLAKAGAGTLTLAASNFYAAGTTLSAGDVVLGNVASLGTGTVTFAGAGAIRNTVGGTIANALAVIAGASGTFDSAANATTLSGAVANAGTLTLTTSATQTLSGALSGTGAFVKAGSGGLTLSGPNTHSGVVSLTAGRLNLNSASALGTGNFLIAGASTLDNTSGAAVTLTGANPQNWDADFTFAGSNALDLGTGAVTLGGNRQVTVTSNTLTVGGGIGGGFSLTKAGAGTLALTGSSGYSGGTTLSAGSLVLGNESALGSGALALDGGSIDLAGLSVPNAVVLGGGGIGSGGTLSGAISGAGGLQKSGAGTLTLSGSNSYSGGTTVTGGTLAVSADSNLGAVPGSATPGSILVDGGVLAATSGFTLDANRGIALGSASGTGSGTIDVASVQTLAYGGVVANNGAGVDGLVKTGAGTLSLTGASSYTGPTTITAGVLELAGAGQLGGGSYAAAIANSGSFAIATSANQTISGSISGAGAITKSGPGTLTLTGNNSFSGPLTVSAGTLAIVTVNNASANGPLGNSASAVVLGSSGNRGTLAYTGVTGTGSKAFTLASGGTAAINVTGGTTLTLSGGMSGSGDFVKEGAGTLAFSTQKTYTGTTTVNAGVLALTGGGDAAGTIRGVVNVNPGATFRLATNDATGYGTTNQVTAINVTSGTLDITTPGGSGGNQTLGNCVITLTAGTMTGVGTTTLDFFQTSSALTTLASSATSTISGIRIGIRQAAGLTFTVADGAADTDLLVSSEIYNNASFTTSPLIKAGAGRMTLTAYSNVTANTNITAGILRLTGSAQLYGAGYNDTAVITIASGAKLELDSFGYGANGGTGLLSAYSARRVMNGGSIDVLGSTQSTGNLFRVANASSGTFSMVQAGQTLTIDDNVNDNIRIGGPLTFGGAGNISVNDVIQDNTGAGSIVKAGAGTLTLNAVNTYTGSTTIDSGTFILGGSGQLGGGNYAGAIANNATFLITSSANQTFSGNVANAGTIAFSSAGNQTLSGVVSGAGSFTKDGTGTFTLSNASNSFSGGTALTDGVLDFVSGGLGTTGTVSLGGGTLRWATGNAEDLSSRLTLANSSTTTLDVGANNVSLASGFGGGSAGGLIKTGDGTLSLAGSNDYTGGTQVTEGTLAFATGGLGSTGNVMLAADTVLQWATGNTQDVSSRLVLPGSGDVTLDIGDNDVSLANGLGAGTAAAVTKSGAGTLTLTGSSGYSGRTTIAGGTVAFSADGAVAATSGVNLQAAESVLDISGANGNRAIGALSGVAGSSVRLGGNSLTAAIDVGSIFGGVISGSGGFTKTGSEQLTFGEAQTFTGAARIAEGTLLLGGGNFLADSSRIDIESGAFLDSNAGVTIVDTQTLGGYGTVYGAVTFDAGSILSPGGSVGQLNGLDGTTTLTGGMTYLFEINDVAGTAGAVGTGLGWDLFDTNGAITLAATGTNPIFLDLISLSGTSSGPAANFDPAFTYAWKFLQAGSEITFDPEWLLLDTSGFENLSANPERFSVVRGDSITGLVPEATNSQLYVVYAAVPEPGTLALAGVGLAAAAWATRRRRGGIAG